MKYIEKIKLHNFKKFKEFKYEARKERNIFIGDNESGKSTILHAIDLVLSGSRSRIENIGLENLFNKEQINSFLAGKKNLEEMPMLYVEIYLNDHSEMRLEGKNNSEEQVHQGMKLECRPLDDYSQDIKEALSKPDPIFPFEFYTIEFYTFHGLAYGRNQKFFNHIFIDSSLIGTDYATRQYTTSLYESHTSPVERYKHNHDYRSSKSRFVNDSFADLNSTLGGSTKFSVKYDGRSNLEQDLAITENSVPISQMGKGMQSIIKTSFSLQRKNNKHPISLILLEEPENHLSHLNMKKLLDKIEGSAGTQLFVATHSNSVSSRLDLIMHHCWAKEKTSVFLSPICQQTPQTTLLKLPTTRY